MNEFLVRQFKSMTKVETNAPKLYLEILEEP